MRIGFTGHRNAVTDEAELDRIASAWPGSVWVHGDAKDGFDAQIKAYARAHGIPEQGIPPKYRYQGDKAAPHIRNREIVNTTAFLVACYDGVRLDGGTYTTVEYAKSKEKHVEYVVCKKLTAGS